MSDRMSVGSVDLDILCRNGTLRVDDLEEGVEDHLEWEKEGQSRGGQGEVRTQTVTPGRSCGRRLEEAAGVQ